MKIIDLLNKIANGEEVPKKILLNGIIFEYKGDYYSHDAGNSYTCYTLGKLNKKTFTPTYYLTNNRNYINQTYLLEQTNDIGYILRYSYNNFLVYKINTSSNILSQIGDTIVTGGKNLGSNPIKIGDYYYFLTDINDTEKGRRYAFNKLKLNTINDTIIEISSHHKNNNLILFNDVSITPYKSAGIMPTAEK